MLLKCETSKLNFNLSWISNLKITNSLKYELKIIHRVFFILIHPSNIHRDIYGKGHDQAGSEGEWHYDHKFIINVFEFEYSEIHLLLYINSICGLIKKALIFMN